MVKHLVSRAAVLLWVVPILSLLLSPAWADTTKRAPARRLLAAGSEQILWMVVSEWDENNQEFARRVLFREAGSDRIHPVTVSPYPHRISVVGVAGNTLHVFRRDGSHVRFSKTRRWTGHELPGGAVPLALAGDVRAGLNRLWAVVPAETAAQVADEWKQRTTRSREDDATLSEGAVPTSPEPAVSALPAMPPKGPCLVMYDGAGWQSGPETPPGYGGEEHVWLAAENGRMYLFWCADDEPEKVRYAFFENDTWVPGAPIDLSGPIERAAAAIINKQVVFASLIKQPDLSNLLCRQWSKPLAASAQDAWDEPAVLQDEQGQHLLLAAGSTLGLFNDRLAVMRFGQDEPELATTLAGAGSKLDQPFEPIPALTGREGPGSPHSVRDLVSTLIVAAVLLLLFWRRQESATADLELPSGWTIAGPARRAAAFLIDAAPALAVMLWLWYDPLANFYSEVRAAAESRQAMREAPTEVLWAWFWFRILYTSYAALFELWWGATPGKRLLGCRVFSENLEKAGPLQIGIRNVARMIELEPFLQIWPFLLIVFFTRNRQRLGDLLARTVVVQVRPSSESENEIAI